MDKKQSSVKQAICVGGVMKKFTQEEFDNFKIIANRKICRRAVRWRFERCCQRSGKYIEGCR